MDQSELDERIKFEEQTWDAVTIPEHDVYPHMECECTPDMLELRDKHRQRIEDKYQEILRYTCTNCGADVIVTRPLDENDMA